MKEKIAERFVELHGDVSYPTSHVIDVTIEVLKAEINKVKNPYPQDYQSANGDLYDAFEEGCQAILKILES